LPIPCSSVLSFEEYSEILLPSMLVPRYSIHWKSRKSFGCNDSDGGIVWAIYRCLCKFFLNKWKSLKWEVEWAIQKNLGGETGRLLKEDELKWGFFWDNPAVIPLPGETDGISMTHR
jgi:hypothetical protein